MMEGVIMTAEQKWMRRYCDQSHSAGPKYAMGFVNQLLVSFHVFDEVECRDNVEAVRRERQLLGIGADEIRYSARAGKAQRLP